MSEELLTSAFYVYMGLVYSMYAAFVAGFMHGVIEDIVRRLK